MIEKHGVLEDQPHLKNMECWKFILISEYDFSSHEAPNVCHKAPSIQSPLALKGCEFDLGTMFAKLGSLL